MRFEPRGNRVLVEPCETEKVSKGGIVLPDSAQKKERQGIIRAMGTGEAGGGLAGLAVGYKVAYAAYSGTEIKIESKGDIKDWLVLGAEDILGVWCS